MLLDLRIQIRHYFERIRIPLDYHKAKRFLKTLISTVFWLHCDIWSLKNDENVPSKSNKQKT